jgi:hypothetical protein
MTARNQPGHDASLDTVMIELLNICERMKPGISSMLEVRPCHPNFFNSVGWSKQNGGIRSWNIR